MSRSSPSALNLSKCKNKNADGEAYDSIALEKIDPKRAFVLKEAAATPGTSPIQHCFDIGTLYNWVVRMGHRTSPESRRPLSHTEYDAIVARYNEVHPLPPLPPQCPLKVYRSQRQGKPVVAVVNPRVPNQWILLTHPRDAHPPTLLTPAPEASAGRAYESLQRDKDLPDHQLSPHAAAAILARLKDTYLRMKRPGLESLNRRPIQVYQRILEWDAEGNPVAVAGTNGGRRASASVKDLQALCRARGIPYSGLRKAELVAVLRRR